MTTERPRVLIVDDDESIVIALERGLRLEGFDAIGADGGRAALASVAEARPDAMVLDLSMPELDGLEVLRRLRADGEDLPICILSARDEVDDRVAGLRAGADDYLVKPFALPELVARIEALLRRSPNAPPVTATLRDLTVDPARRRVTRDGREVELTKREFDVLEMLVRNAGIVVSRSQLLDEVWGYDFEVESNVVDVYVGYIRRKLEADGGDRMVHTVRGIGFVLR